MCCTCLHMIGPGAYHMISFILSGFVSYKLLRLFFSFMCVCVYSVCMYVHTVWVWVCLYVCVYLCVFVCVPYCMCVCVCVLGYICVYAFLCMSMLIYVHST